jgi:hypothetical protein
MPKDAQNNLIVTAASKAFGPSLLALLGSLTLNWPDHPPILVYDLGLDKTTLNWLETKQISVTKIPSFCPHWRQHFTWKIWCLNDANAQNILWMDSGLMVLQPLNEIFEVLHSQGYFFTVNYESLEWEASEEACKGCGLSMDFRNNKLTLAGGLMGFRKDGTVSEILKEALSVALVEKNIAATEVTHRHDQAIISLLAYKHLKSVVVADGTVYLAALSPRQIPGQKIWVHRRKLLPRDMNYLAAHIGTPGTTYAPSEPYPLTRAKSLAHLYRVYWNFGRGKLAEAKEHLEMAFAIDATLKVDMSLLADTFARYRHRLQGFSMNANPDFLAWILKELEEINGSSFVLKLSNFLNRNVASARL